MLPCSARWAAGAVSPASGHVLGSVLGLGRGLPSWGHKSHFAHMLHPSSVSSILSSILLLCTRRGKVIFCLKLYYNFFLFKFLFQKAIGLFCLLGKEGLGLLGEEWEIPRVPLQQSQLGSVAVTSSNLASFSLPQSQTLHLGASVPCCHRGLNCCLAIPGGFDPCATARRRRGKGHGTGSSPMLTPSPASRWEPKAALARARGTAPAWHGALRPDSPSSSVNQIANSSLQRRNWASW